MKLKLLSCLFFGIVLVGKAQNYEQGVIITHAGDTLKGLVAKYDALTMAFKKERNSAQDLVPMKEILGYTYEGDDYEEYEIEVIRNNFPEKVKAYLRVVLDGPPLRLLEYRGKGLFGSEHVGFYLHHDQEVPYRVNRNPSNFKQSMKLYFHENKELAMKIRKGELTYDNLVEIVTSFNAWYMAQEPEPQEKQEDKAQ